MWNGWTPVQSILVYSKIRHLLWTLPKKKNWLKWKRRNRMGTYFCRCSSSFKRIAGMRMRWFCCCCRFGWCSCRCSCSQWIGYVICGQWLRYCLQRRSHCCRHCAGIVGCNRVFTDEFLFVFVFIGFCSFYLWKLSLERTLWAYTHNLIARLFRKF